MIAGRKRILIIDDEADLVALIKEQISACGYDAATAYSGEEGLKSVAAAAPDLIILDVVMPGIDGFQLFKAIKKYPATANIPVIMLTARENMRETFTSLNADEFIAKPFSFEELLDKVSFLLSNKVLVMAGAPAMKENLTSAFRNTGHEPYFVDTEEEMCNKMKEYKFKKIIIHLAVLKKNPEELLSAIATFRYKNPDIMMYCDAMVKGAEEDYQVAIDAIKREWKNAGIESFYDARISKSPLDAVLKSWVAS